MPLLLNVVLTLYPREKRGVAMGVVGFAVVFAPAIGPTVAGYILETYPWQILFYSFIPIVIAVIVIGYFYLTNVSETVQLRID